MDGQTDGQMNKRTETCTPKSPMLKQVRQQNKSSYSCRNSHTKLYCCNKQNSLHVVVETHTRSCTAAINKTVFI